ncbi:hypothetical protein Y695_03420 [Hydrogenophaga sp. T4]|nr:hypothetical protein Y695_03420 [Hydrogenophaga sp. T4]
MDALFMLAPQAACRNGSNTRRAFSRTASGIMATMPRDSTNWKLDSTASCWRARVMVQVA